VAYSSEGVLIMKKKNYELENEFNEWKDKEDQQLRELNYPEEKIASLRKFDHDLFVNKARRQQRKEQITADAFFIAIPTYDKKDINTFMDLLDIVESESLFMMLKNTDKQLQQIILMKYYGYEIEEISKLLNIKPDTIYKKIQRFKEKMNKN
jgi:DNA-directed RNA polymerase specialized sigma24 family protein